ncbi:ATP-binding cassette domain-containing protein [Streptomyces sp. AK08-02]|nr:ATP-binding cassette domain-containing protein [Streptomyces sp. AK08-02]
MQALGDAQLAISPTSLLRSNGVSLDVSRCTVHRHSAGRRGVGGGPLVDRTDLRVIFGRRSDVPALDGVALAVAPGSATGIVGASGSGKTTLVRAVVGLQPVTAGTISLDGVALSTGLRGRSREQRRWVQLVTQAGMT